MSYKELTIATKEDVEAGINDGFGGIYSKDGKRFLKYTDNSKDIYTVKDGTEVICSGAFESYQPMCKLKYLLLPDSLVAIGAYAFRLNTKLSKVNLPSKLQYIGNNAFECCKSLRKIILPVSLSQLGISVFDGTRRDFKIVSNSPNFKVENGALLTVDGSRLILVKTDADQVIIPSSVKTIDGNAFDAPNMRCLTIPDNVEKIGTQDFGRYKQCNFRSLAILNPNLKFEAWGINPGSSIVVVLVPERRRTYFSKHIAYAQVIQEFRESEREYMLQPGYDYRKVIPNEGTYSEDGKMLLKYRGTGLHYEIRPGTEVIAEGAFKDNFALEYIYIPDTIVKIEHEAFCCCWYLQEITLPDSVQIVEDEAFCSCGNLEYVHLSPNMRKIGDKVFYGCENLREINIPKGLTAIGNEAFGFCSKLWYVRLPETLIELQGFNYCENLGIIEVPSSVKVIKACAFYSSAIKTLILHEGLEEIGDNAFALCEIEEVQLPNSVKFIGNCAFFGEGHEHINIPPHAVLGKHNPFEGSKVKIDCQNPDYQLVDDVLYTADGKKIIAYLSTKKEFHIPEVVEVIGEGAFGNQPQLERLYVSKKVETEDSFAYLYGELHLPKELESEYKNIIAYQRHHAVID